MSALDHYRRVFSNWIECDYGGADWIEFEDASGGERRRVQQRARAWLSPTNDNFVIVALRYVHPLGGAAVGSGGLPQNVELVRRTTRDAAAELRELGATCRTGSALDPAKLQELEVLALAAAAITKAGVRINDHLAPELAFERDGYWRVTYRGKGDRPGDWVGVLVNDSTREVEVIPGM